MSPSIADGRHAPEVENEMLEGLAKAPDAPRYILHVGEAQRAGEFEDGALLVMRLEDGLLARRAGAA
jgi:hypothetical protein